MVRQLSKSLLSAITEAVGGAYVTVQPVLTIAPQSVDALSRAVRMLTDARFAVIPRGKCSDEIYAAPALAKSAEIDMSGLNRIVEISEADRYVTVEAGCSWTALQKALITKNLRTPFLGARHGGAYSVGGLASHNAAFFGSGLYGTMADSVLGVDVVLADGSLVETGAAAAEGRTPFLRHFGPDLTGIFLGDSGAFGIKARITLKLIPRPASEGFLSFAFERFEDMAEAQAVLARENIAAEQWGIDPRGNDILATQGFKFLEGLAFEREIAGVDGGMGQKMATHSRSLVDGHRSVIRGGYSLHIAVEGRSPKEAELKIGHVRRLLMPMALKELPNAAPQTIRSQSLTDALAVPKPQGLQLLSIHGLFPLSRAMEIAAVTDEYFVRHRDAMKINGIAVSCVTAGVSTAFMIEPEFSWRDNGYPNARALVTTLARDLALLWGAFGAAHFQVGATYEYAGALSSAALVFLKSLKSAVDPKGLINPGALNLGAAQRKNKPKFAEFPQDLLKDR